MTWLFIRLYFGVLGVLFLAWYIHGTVLEHRSNADLARVIWAAHAGGARLVAQQIDDAPAEDRLRTLRGIQSEFAYPVDLRPVDDVPATVKEQFSRQDVAYYREGNHHFVVATVSCEPKCVWLGPFPSYRLSEVEDSIGGWMKLVAKEVAASDQEQRQATLNGLRETFQVPLELTELDALPAEPRERIERGAKIVFYEQEPSGSDRYFSAISVERDNQAVRFGPFPSFEHIEQKAATTTLGLVLLPAALAIAFLIRPIVLQLRRVENAAKAIASGDLNARVGGAHMQAAKPLADAFNRMADRTQLLVKSQRELLQAVSHELRTPLARIRFAADLLETAKSDEERRERLNAVDDATQQLDDLVGELLTYVRAESEAAEIEAEAISVREMLAETIDTLAPLYPDIEFQQMVHGGDMTVESARPALMRAISNLTRNATGFADSQVTLSADQVDDAVRIIVDDDGPGIPEDKRDRVFEPFVRLDESNRGGSGLGLALVQRIVSSQQGVVRVGSSPQGGARFEILLPISADPRPAAHL